MIACCALDALVADIRAQAGRPVLLVAAFDGVLTDYQANPGLVRLPLRRRARLRRLRQRRDVTLAIISGRRVRDVQRRAGLDEQVFYIGLHGLEIAGPGFSARHAAVDVHHDRLRGIHDDLRPTLEAVRGVTLEFKDAAIALHTREAGSEDAIWCRFQLLNSVAPLLGSGVLRVIRGHDVLEVLPNAGASRAAAIEAIRRRLQRDYAAEVFTLYLGPDTTDDDAFQAINGRSIGIVVGSRRPEEAVHLRPDDVDPLLEAVIDRRASGGGEAG